VCHCCDEIAPVLARSASAKQLRSGWWAAMAKSRAAPGQEGGLTRPSANASRRLFNVKNQAPEDLSACSERTNPAQVMSLKDKGDFLMHGVVLQIRVWRPPAR
jgi:hypothetical protein